MITHKYICTSCGYNYSKYHGRCFYCLEYDTITENEHPVKVQKIKKRSKKGQKRHKTKSEVYIEIDTKAMNEDNFICWGCGGQCGLLSHSHLIPGDKFLTEKHNIWLMGYGNSNSCHDLWETHNIENLRKIPNYKEALKAVKELDENYYYKLIKEK